MSETERQELIAALTLVTGWNSAAYETMSDEELQREYDRRVVGL